MRVKGTMIMDYVKVVQSNKDRDWGAYFEPQDWEVINGPILASSWYPYETFRRIGFAIFKEIAGSNLDLVRAFGHHTIKNILAVYKTVLIEGYPVESQKNLDKLTRRFFDVDASFQIIDSGPDWVRIKPNFPSIEKDPEAPLAYCHQFTGSLEEIVEQASGKKVRSSLQNKDDMHKVEITISWG